MREEVTVGTYRVDLAGVHDGHPVFIEIAVTHAVEEDKREALDGLGVRCFEITLDPSLHGTWTWETLGQGVLGCPGNRRWLFHPELAQLREQARCEAVAKAFEKPVVASGAPERTRLRLHGVPVHLVDQGWGLCLWWPYNERINAMLKAIAKAFGGRYNSSYRNWVLPVGTKAAVLEQLERIGAVRENCDTAVLRNSRCFDSRAAPGAW
jgi:competence protein CoiA